MTTLVLHNESLSNTMVTDPAKIKELIRHSSKGTLLLLNLLKASGFARFNRYKYESHTNITHLHKMQNCISVTVFTKLLQDVRVVKLLSDS